jgi:chemotaxis methyl-accepting protein methylase/flagellar motor protein MotB
MPKKSKPTLGVARNQPRKRVAPHLVEAVKTVAFPIVGIGASAGGLEALELFLSRVPQPSGIAFVIIQHLDPTRKGMMVELLQRATVMPVTQVTDRVVVKPGCVYVIPPNKDLSLLHGVLHLLTPASPRGLRLPIDFFLRSLAQDRQEQAIGVLLSGMGSDGTLGLRAIKEKSGVVLVQDPASAKFDGMPRSAIDSGVADIVAPVEELPGRILACLRRTPLVQGVADSLSEGAQDALDKAVVLLRAQTGHDFSAYKQNTFYRRIERRMGIHQIEEVAGYIRYLGENPQEVELLFKELLIGVTRFFRDAEVWDELVGQVLPALIASRPNGHVFRFWVPACSTGEEAYSLGMAFKEVMAKLKPARKCTLSIFATDLDRDGIDKARHGVYPENIVADVSQPRLDRFFSKVENGYRVRPEIRELVVFAPQSLILDPPFTKLDLLSCRNLLIYLVPEMQKKLLPLFHFSLRPGGILVLGNAETVGTFTNLFSSLGARLRVYRRAESSDRQEPIDFPPAFSPSRSQGPSPLPELKSPLSLQSVADQLVLDRYAPSAVLVNERGSILYVSGRTGRYLEPAAGKANWNLLVMAREGLRYELAAALQQVHRKPGPEVLRNLRVGDPEGARFVDVVVERLESPEALRGMVMVTFSEVGSSVPPVEAGSRRRRATKVEGSPSPSERWTEMERRHQQVCLELQTTREQMQTSQEELRSTNEEMQSTNEEMQSTNEELTTSKEELQSLNEELQTVNAELQVRVDELSRANNDMKNLLNSTDIATLFLDDDLRVRRFTTQATHLIKLIPGDVGRPITDLASDLLYPELVAEARDVLRRSGFAERLVATTDGRWFTVRVMPYRTLDDRVDGVVITFADQTAGKAVEADLRARYDGLVRQLARQAAHRRGLAARARLAPAGEPGTSLARPDKSPSKPTRKP